jgi:flagellar basal body-associated protein FliL
MAEPEKTNTEQDSEPQAEQPKGAMSKIMPWLIALVVVIVCGGAGFAVGRLFGTRGKAQTVSAAQKTEPAASASSKEPAAGANGQTTWYYDLEPTVANLNEPGVTRYVRVALTLEVGNGLGDKEGLPLLDQKKPLMKHWLTLYLSNQTVETIRGEKNLRQVQTQIADVLNQGLFPNAKPRIVRVLFKEFAIQ